MWFDNTRILRGDQIEVLKIKNGYEDVDKNMFFKLKEGSTTSFSQRVINEWNKLPNDCVNASSVIMF